MAAVAAAASPQPRRLRVGLFADARLQPRWIVEAFDKVARSDFADIVLISAGDSPPGGRKASLVWKLYGKLDRWAFGADPSERVDLASLRALGCAPDPRRHELDVAFALGDVDDAALDGVAAHGVWRFCFGAERDHAEGLAGWREVAAGAPVTGSGIKVKLAQGTPPRLAYQSWSRTYPLSVARNRAQLLRKTAEFAFRALRELHRSGRAWLEQCKIIRECEGARALPANTELLSALPAIGGRIAERAVQKALSVDQWFLAWRFGERRFGENIPADLQGYTRAMPPRNREWADPFGPRPRHGVARPPLRAGLSPAPAASGGGAGGEGLHRPAPRVPGR